MTDTQWDEYWQNFRAPAWPAYTDLRRTWFMAKLLLFRELLLFRDRWGACTIWEPGAGMGYCTKVLCQVFPDSAYYASDLSGEAEDQLRRLPFPNLYVATPRPHSIDIVVCGDVIEHVEWRSLFLNDLAKTMRPKATLYLTTPNGCNPATLLKLWRTGKGSDQPFDKPLTMGELKRALRLADFEILDASFHRVGSPPPDHSRTWWRRWARKATLAVLACILRGLGQNTAEAIFVTARYAPEPVKNDVRAAEAIFVSLGHAAATEAQQQFREA